MNQLDHGKRRPATCGAGNGQRRPGDAAPRTAADAQIGNRPTMSARPDRGGPPATYSWLRIASAAMSKYWRRRAPMCAGGSMNATAARMAVSQRSRAGASIANGMWRM